MIVCPTLLQEIEIIKLRYLGSGHHLFSQIMRTIEFDAGFDQLFVEIGFSHGKLV